ncbi:uncharacterized protein MELLADRAFT_51063 [Melampsora larici-populina 98AG31]|uniref:Aminomethyltransferase n=1 Tax=Melampsora larici-populina (strain 98AG31 / pathotype 3-4-7) TaxID=747676 RepID=F4SAZ0_MELLP|nr:uncharacterized protein MELLADRAFT_51063 [Melampsora larici-populina 98AG31]EGF98199.1 hypothetical protein MELLADRAFT_51063 [Melampsora larici-populina 98AG31]
MTMITLRSTSNLFKSTSIFHSIKPHQFKFSTYQSQSQSESNTTLKRTPLYSIHTQPENGAKMVPFAGFEMPLSYTKSGEHMAVRNACGLFDVSHMVQSKISGPSATEFLLKLLPASLKTMKPFTSTLSVMLNEEGGIIDDCMITKWSDQEWYLVTNANRRQRDLNWINQHIQSFDAKIEVMENWGLIALQGPKSSEILQTLLDDSSLKLNDTFFFGQSVHTEINGIQVHIARSGYTGEDGFEISIPPNQSESITSSLLNQPGVTLAGLAARDSLRLEAGLCLYGTDLDETVGVGEAGLGWVIGNQRTGFLGEERTRKEIGSEIKRRRVGLLIEKGAPARSGAMIFNKKNPVGVITSGIPSPSLSNQNIAMGFVGVGFHQRGTELKVSVRDKDRTAKVVKMPFVTPKYFKPKTS